MDGCLHSERLCVVHGSRFAFVPAATARGLRMRSAAGARRSFGPHIGCTTSNSIGTARSGAPGSRSLLRRHTVITYDWRGCGLSDRHGVDLSFERHVDDLEAVIGAAGINRFTLIGMVNGAAVSMAYTRRHAERVSQLVLYASYARGRLVRDTTPSVIEEARTRLKVIELGWPNESPGYGQFFTSLHLPDASPEQMRSYNEMLRQATSPATAAGLLKTFFSIDLRETARLIRCPTLRVPQSGRRRHSI